MLKTLFLGNSDFSIPTLELLLKKTDLKAIITGQDRVITKRQKTLVEPEPKVLGKEHGIEILQPTKLKDENLLETIKNYHLDLMVVISYGRLIPVDLFSLSKQGCFNLHGSLLPNYRGASPLQESLLRGDTLTGITLQKINEKIDHGNIYLQNKLPIHPDMLYPELRSKMSFLARDLLEEFLSILNTTDKTPPPQEQVGKESYCGKIQKEDSLVNFKEESAESIYNKYRAFYHWPEITTTLKGTKMKLKKIKPVSVSDRITPGTVINANKEGLVIKTKKDAIALLEAQPENKKIQDFISLINGYKFKEGELV